MISLSLLRIAVQALWGHKLRSGLTLLGVIIGVTSVMTIISALEGMMGVLKSEFDRLGPTTFIATIYGGVITSEQQWRERQKRKPMKIADVELVEDGCDLCYKVCPRSFTAEKVKYRGKSLRDMWILGTTYQYIDIVDIEAAYGRFHSREDDLHRRNVIFIGDEIRQTLFEDVDPIGKSLQVGSRKYTIIGVARAQGTMFGESRDGFAVIPLSSYIKQFGDPGRRLNMYIQAATVEEMDDAMDQVRIIMRSARHVPYDKPDDFSLLTPDAILEQLNTYTALFRFALMGISAISLVIGGIVVMNVMMVSVSERTREIGIRKAIGARRKHILLQFLFESLLTTMSGGFIGIVLGFGAAYWLVSMIDANIEPSGVAIAAGLIISTGTGLIFGIYPAMKAAKLDPIKALSQE